MSTTIATKTVIAYLTPEVYKRLEEKMGAHVVNPATSAIQAGYHLGIQHALKIIRDGIVVG